MLDLLSCAPKEVKFGARTLKIGALKLKELGLLQRWIRDHSERPTVAVKRVLEFYPPEEHRQLLKDAVMDEREWPPAVGTYDGNSVFLGDEEGQLFFLRVMLVKFQPELVDDAFLDEVAASLSPEDFGVLVSIAFGEDDLDPEALRAKARDRLAALAKSLAPANQNEEQASTSEASTTPSS